MCDTTHPRDPRDVLEDALVDIQGVADVLHAIGFNDNGVAYLSNRLKEHYEVAEDAFARIYKLGEYREEEAQS